MTLLKIADIEAYGDEIHDPNSLKDFNELLTNAIDNKDTSVTINKVDYSQDQINSISAEYTVVDNELVDPFNLTYTVSGWKAY